MKGIDVSHYQNIIDWAKVKKDFAVIKCTQGVSFIDGKFARNKDEARKAGILCGYYHFANGGDIIKEADFFVDNVGELAKGEFLVLDWEIKHSGAVGWCKRFLDRVKERTGISPFIYINTATAKALDWTECLEYPLWIANYGVNNGEMNKEPNTGQWKDYVIWQYTSRGRVDGISGNVDLNIANISKDDFIDNYGMKEGEIIVKDEVMKMLKYPIDKIYITQKFGERPEVYKQFGMKGHNGIDFRTKFWDSPLGKRYITASKSGVIIESGNEGSKGYGIFLRMKHKGSEQTLYGHLKKVYVKVGQFVEKGKLIGLSDNTGFSSGSHLHFGYRPDGWEKIYNNGFKGYIDPIDMFEA